MHAVRKVDISTASTLKDTDDLDLDDTDASRSEGEFLQHGDLLNPETDPVLALLMQMQHQPGGFRQYDLPAARVQHVLGATGRSAGEVAQNGGGHGPVGVRKSAGEVAQNGGGHGPVGVRKSAGEVSDGQVFLGDRGVTMVTPKVDSPAPPTPTPMPMPMQPPQQEEFERE